MKTIRKNKTVELLLGYAKQHLALAETDLDYLDMASEEINVAFRMTQPKDDCTIADVLNEIYEVTGYDKLYLNDRASKYIKLVGAFKYELKHRKEVN